MISCKLLQKSYRCNFNSLSNARCNSSPREEKKSDHSIPVTVALSLLKHGRLFFKVITLKCARPCERCVVSMRWFGADWLAVRPSHAAADSETRRVFTTRHRIGVHYTA